MVILTPGVSRPVGHAAPHHLQKEGLFLTLQLPLTQATAPHSPSGGLGSGPTARNLAYLPLVLVGKHLNGRVCILPRAPPVRTSRMKVLTEQGVRGTRPEVDLPLPRCRGRWGESPGATLGAGDTGRGTAFTCAGLCLLQLQKLLQEAAIGWQTCWRR